MNNPNFSALWFGTCVCLTSLGSEVFPLVAQCQCIQFALLYNELLQNVAAWNNIHLVSPSFCGSGIQGWLRWEFWLSSSHEAAGKTSGGCSPLSIWLSFQDCSLPCVLARVVIPHWFLGFSMEPQECPTTWQLPFPEQVILESKGKPHSFHHLASEVTFHSFHNILWLHKLCLFSVRCCGYTKQKLLRWSVTIQSCWEEKIQWQKESPCTRKMDCKVIDSKDFNSRTSWQIFNIHTLKRSPKASD